jgi:hypothetical protein
VKNLIKNFIKKKFAFNQKSYDLNIDNKEHVIQAGYTTTYQKALYNLNLNELFILFQTDKGSIYQNLTFDIKNKSYRRSIISGHNYGLVYEKFLKLKRFEYKNIVEIGAWEGTGAAAFFSYFPNATIFSLDISFKFDKVSADRIIRILCDQSDKIQINNFLLENEIQNNLDVVIDDGKHDDNCVLTSFNILFKNLKSSNYYFIEDITEDLAPVSYKIFDNISKKKINEPAKINIDEDNLNQIDFVEKFESQREIKKNGVKHSKVYLFAIKKK